MVKPRLRDKFVEVYDLIIKAGVDLIGDNVVNTDDKLLEDGPSVLEAVKKVH